jgi:dienelactone hydrolase
MIYKTVYLFLILIFCVSKAKSEECEYKKVGKIITNLIFTDKFDSLDLYLSDALIEKLNYSYMRTTISFLEMKYGEFHEIIDYKVQAKVESNLYRVGVKLEKENFDIIYTFDENCLLASLYLRKYTHPITDWEPPPYCDTNLFSTEEVILKGKFDLKGELALPKNIKDPPIMIFIHGSGPNDLDESSGPNKMFKDIAWGLASMGIGSLRYNKRSFEHQETISRRYEDSLTIFFEVVDDVLLAIDFLKNRDFTNIFLIGHSFGGHLIPLINSLDTSLAGNILLAANYNSLETLVIPQIEYLISVDSNYINPIQFNIIKNQIEQIRNKEFTDSTPKETLLFKLPPKYWNSLLEYQPTDFISNRMRFLILNGDLDHQVPPDQAYRWQNEVNNKKSDLIIYDELNHLFMNNGEKAPHNYNIKNNVDKQIIDDIFTWINKKYDG